MRDEGSKDILGDARHSTGKCKELVNAVIDVLAELAWVDTVAQLLQVCTLWWEDGCGSTYTVERRARLIVASAIAYLLAVFRDRLLGAQAHDWLEKVVVEPHLVV